MPVNRRHISIIHSAAILILAAIACRPAQPQATPSPQPSIQASPSPTLPPRPIRTLILLDPAHGGPDPGARLTGNLLEKDLTLAFSNRLRALLSAAGFGVISTRTADPATLFTTNQRAEIANHDHPAVCLILHATGSGFGVHLFTSALNPPTSSRPPTLLHWNTAQVPSIPASRAIANEIGLALLHARLPVILGHASVPPLDNLTCPAIAIELAPLTNAGSTPTPASDASYQQHAAEAIAAALTAWRADNITAGAAQ